MREKTILIFFFQAGKEMENVKEESCGMKFGNGSRFI